MSFKLSNQILAGLLLASLAACSSVTSESSSSGPVNSDPDPSSGDSTGWTIPSDRVFVGQSRDGIPSIDNPVFQDVSEVDNLEPDELVLGLKIGDQVKAYPHVVLYYHEIVNDHLGDEPVAVTYCPLTGTGLAWNRMIDGEETTFGVSGLIYKNNLIAYDRKTESYWSQMLAKGVKGPKAGEELETYQLIETTWKSWKEAYPNSKVLMGPEGIDRAYDTYPYGNYPENNDYILFPIGNEDDRLERKKLMHGIFFKSALGVRVMPIESFTEKVKVVHRQISQNEIVIAGSSTRNLTVSYFRQLEEGPKLEFDGISGEFPVIMEDQKGNRWNVFGEAVSGPRKGERLTPVPSYNGYWFAWVDFFGDAPRRPPIIYP